MWGQPRRERITEAWPDLTWPCLFLQPSVSCTFSYSSSATPNLFMSFVVCDCASGHRRLRAGQSSSSWQWFIPPYHHHHQCFVGLALLPSCPCVLQSWDPKGPETLGHSLPMLSPWPALCWPGLLVPETCHRGLGRCLCCVLTPLGVRLSSLGLEDGQDWSL